MSKAKLEYIWLDGYEPTQSLRSKTRIESDFGGTLEECPQWSFDGSSTEQAEGGDSDCLLEPCAIIPDPDRKDRALTTVATMLKKMEKKGVVGHRAEGRQYVYFPAVAERDVQRSMVSDLCDRLFQGDMTALVSHLLTDQEIDATELARLRALIEEREDEDERPATDA